MRNFIIPAFAALALTLATTASPADANPTAPSPQYYTMTPYTGYYCAPTYGYYYPSYS
jgi:hypothetical protein